MAFTSDSLSPWLPQLKQAARCYVAYSGGLDSHVLLHAIVRVLGAEAVTTVHVNHQLSENADCWTQHCQQQCELLGVRLITETVFVNMEGQGVEQAAREARYGVFARLLKEDDLMLMAHHADDQVETVLYRLLRGSGVRGLAGMPQQRQLGRGSLLRPLLNYQRAELEEYARGEKLSWIDDESNFAIDFDRNFLRHEVVPVIAARWHDYTERISHSASLCRESDNLLASVAENDLNLLNERTERLGWSIALPELLDLSPFRRASLLRYWVESKGLVLPGHRVLDTIEHELLMAREDASPLVTWGDAEMRRYRECLYLLKSGRVTTDSEISADLHWDMEKPLLLPDGSTLSASQEQQGGLSVSAGATVKVSFRQGGERCRPAGRSGSNTLKKLLQEAGLEPWLRAIVPLVYVNGELAAVGDLWVCEGFRALPGQVGKQLAWELN